MRVDNVGDLVNFADANLSPDPFSVNTNRTKEDKACDKLWEACVAPDKISRYASASASLLGIDDETFEKLINFTPGDEMKLCACHIDAFYAKLLCLK